MPENSAPRIAVRHVQLARAVVAAVAALVITFSADHSAPFGLAVFCGFAVATAIVFGVAAWSAAPRGHWAPVTLAIVSLVAGLIAAVPAWHTTAVFFAVVISWAAVTGVVEGVAGWRARRSSADPQQRSEARDAVTVGIIGVVLAAGLGLVNPDFRLDYFIDDADAWFALTGTAIGVGIFGGYAAIIAVYLGIAAFSPRRDIPATVEHSAPTEEHV